MTEFVVTLNDGRRIDVEADEYGTLDGLHQFRTRSAVREYGSERVLCVQRRDGMHLEQVWPPA